MRHLFLLPIAAIIGFVALVSSVSAHPSSVPLTFVVNSFDDLLDSNVGDDICAATGNVCTLRAAVMEANVRTDLTTIELPTLVGPYGLLNANFEDAGLSGDLDLIGPMHIVGDGTASIQNYNLDRILDIFGNNVTIEGVVIEYGFGQVSTPQFDSNGAGIRINAGAKLVLKDSIVRHNTNVSDGGGIMVSGKLKAVNVTIEDNEADHGGGVTVGGTGTATFKKSLIQLNEANSLGGGIYSSGNARVIKTLVEENHSDEDGGGIYAIGHLLLKKSALAFNIADAFGGGLTLFAGDGESFQSSIYENTAQFGGGGIMANASTLEMTNSTISSNVTVGDTGGMVLASTDVLLNNVTIAQNYMGGVSVGAGSTLEMRNTLLAKNVVGFDLAGAADDCAGTINSLKFNLIGDTTNCTIVGQTTGDQYNLDPLIDSLADNGGETLTHALFAGSPAIDKGKRNGCKIDGGGVLVNDQRDHPRHVDGDGNGVIRCDIGSYEYEP